MVLEKTGLGSRFERTNLFEKYARGLEILTKMSKNMQVWFGDLNFGTFLLISLDSGHAFQYRFVR